MTQLRTVPSWSLERVFNRRNSSMMGGSAAVKRLGCFLLRLGGSQNSLSQIISFCRPSWWRLFDRVDAVCVKASPAAQQLLLLQHRWSGAIRMPITSANSFEVRFSEFTVMLDEEAWWPWREREPTETPDELTRMDDLLISAEEGFLTRILGGCGGSDQAIERDSSSVGSGEAGGAPFARRSCSAAITSLGCDRLDFFK